MHELSLVNELLEIIDDYGRTHRFEKVNALKLSFGRLSCIDPSALRFAFEVQSQDTKARGATLDFDILPIVIHCLACGKESTVERYPAACPACATETVLMTGGTESLQFLEMDVD